MTELQEVALGLLVAYLDWLDDEMEELNYLSARNFVSSQMDYTDTIMDGVADELLKLAKEVVC